ncbi:hypothetical protein FRD01_12135 [Microvenator marinus]|jgi:hypothetical protein|uniref:Uncharacterized protein n=1 Tax=Microvenator marinus TaxID=2600177 RepID=A0A5B8XRN6_9DELT|nr:hypothetical protein [Microvenator marinus]QED27971.1 hypothetical protein FRD01_12135 [Microvenator marinus]
MVDEKLWQEDPEKAARLAFMELQLVWEEQVDEGEYLGIPNFDLSLRGCSPYSHVEDTCGSKTVQTRPSEKNEKWRAY